MTDEANRERGEHRAMAPTAFDTETDALDALDSHIEIQLREDPTGRWDAIK